MNKIVKDMAAFREQALEGLGGEGVTFQPEDDGELFLVKHPLLLDEGENQLQVLRGRELDDGSFTDLAVMIEVTVTEDVTDVP